MAQGDHRAGCRSGLGGMAGPRQRAWGARAWGTAKGAGQRAWGVGRVIKGGSILPPKTPKPSKNAEKCQKRLNRLKTPKMAQNVLF